MSISPLVGGDLLRLVTAGMYDNPLDLYREYVQNSADAIAACGANSGSVHLKIDPVHYRITIIDNGAGLSPKDAVRRLVDVGNSVKDPTVDRGFRGIGRLCALAFAEKVHFTTRTRASEAPTRVTWDGRALRELDLSRVDASTAIEKCTTTSRVSDGSWPDRFFQVIIDRVNRHAASTVLNEDVVRSYVGEVCPVPMATCFPLANQIRDFLAARIPYFVLDVHLNDDDRPVLRPFAETIPLTDQYGAPFEDLETHVIPRTDGDDPAAILWLAHTPYAGSIPRRLGVRGLRARVGNLQIGTDRVFEHLFLDPRFNGWCVGEVHILDNRIAPNGRRDYFEPSPHLRNIENRLGAIAQGISSRCRLASSQRNKLRNVGSAIHRLRCAYDLATSGYLAHQDAVEMIERERKRILEIKNVLNGLKATTEAHQEQIADYETKLGSVETKPTLQLNGVPSRSRRTVQDAFGAIAETVHPDSALQIIEAILHRLSKEQSEKQLSK